jgi:hypothetical protein
LHVTTTVARSVWHQHTIRALLLFLLFMATTAVIATSEPQQEPQLQEALQLIRQGDQLIQQQRYGEAADLLERALLLLPVTDTVVAAQAATLYLQALARNNGYNKVALKYRSSWQIEREIELRVGVGDNLNQGPSAPVFTLTFPEGFSLLQLSPEQHPESGHALEAHITVTAKRQLNVRQQVGVVAKLMQRETSSHGLADYKSATLQGLWAEERPGGHNVWGMVGGSIYQYGGEQPTLHALQGMVRYTVPNEGRCQYQWGGDLLLQRQEVEQALDGRYIGGVVGAQCQTPVGDIMTTLSTGKDWARFGRPGGDQRRWRVHVIHQRESHWPVKHQQIQFEVGVLHQKDQQGYSDWLANGAQRDLTRLQWSLRDQWPLGDKREGWRWSAELNWMRQNSNIELFDTQAAELWLGIKKSW